MLSVLLAATMLAAPLPTSARPAASAMTDAQILGLVAEIDAAEIEEAKLALTKTHSAAVRNYADMLITDHQKSLSSGKALAAQINVTPVANPDTSLGRDHAKEMVKLQGLSGADFDKEFAKDNADGHRSVIDKVNSQLIPDATNAKLKAHLRALLPVLRKHEQGALALEKH